MPLSALDFTFNMRLLFAVLVLFAAPAIAQQRLAVPSYLSCDRNQLTSWIGVVNYLQHRGSTLSLRISTDFKTEESLHLNLPNEASLVQQMRLNDAPFTAKDWGLLYDTNGILRHQLRAVIWLCSDQHIKPVINWQPPSES